MTLRKISMNKGKKIYIYKYQERQSMGAFMRIIIIYRTDQQQRDREGKGEKNKSRLYTRVRAILTGPLTIIHHPWYLFFYFVYFFFHFFTLYTPIYVAHIISCARTREKTIRQTIKLFFIHTAGQTHTTKYLKKKKLRYNIIIITGVNSEFTRRDTRRCMRVYNEINEITRIKYYTRTWCVMYVSLFFHTLHRIGHTRDRCYDLCGPRRFRNSETLLSWNKIVNGVEKQKRLRFAELKLRSSDLHLRVCDQVRNNNIST